MKKTLNFVFISDFFLIFVPKICHQMRLNTHIIIRILTVILMTAGLFGGECFAYDWTGNGTSSNPYQLKSLDDWNEFYSNIGSYYNQSIILKTDLDVGARYINYQFWGIFDGNGHTINISLSDRKSVV